jgi:RimJ/RimL family protein N-acetyltransferase
MIELSTARLRLEPLEPRHADGLFEGLQHPAIYAFIADAPPASIDALRDRYARLARRVSPDGAEEWLNWALRGVEEERLLGYVQATLPEEGDASIAYVLVPEAWGRGYAREAVAAMMDHLGAAYGRAAVRATVDTRNARSVALLEALGFERVRVREGAEWIGGVSTDEAEYRRRLRRDELAELGDEL